MCYRRIEAYRRFEARSRAPERARLLRGFVAAGGDRQGLVGLLAAVFGPGAEVAVGILEDLAHGLRDVLVVATDQARASLDDGDPAAEAAEQLGQLAADHA